MKIPTYARQTAAPRSGGGQFLTAQLNTGAMMAPANAQRAAFQQLSSTAANVSEIAFKKAEVNAQTAALAAANTFQVELETLREQSKQMTPGDAEKLYMEGSVLAENRSAIGLNRLGRNEFKRRASTIRSQQQLHFLKESNTRYRAQAKANMIKNVDEGARISSNLSLSDEVRMEGYIAARLSIANSLSTVDAADAAEAELKLVETVARDIAYGLVSDSASPVAVISQFSSRESSDHILSKLFPALSNAQIESITKDMTDVVTRQTKTRNEARSETNRVAKEGAEEVVRSIYFDEDISLEQKLELFASIKDSVHIPAATLKIVETFLYEGGRGAAQDIEEDVLAAARDINADAIRTDAELITAIAVEGWNLSAETIRTTLIPLIKSKRDAIFTQAREWGEAELGFTASMNNSPIEMFQNKAKKAAKLRANLLDWREKNPGKDIWQYTRQQVEDLKNTPNQAALVSLPAVSLRYRAAVSDGDATKIADLRLALITIMVAGNMVSARDASRIDFDPLDIIDGEPQE